jgi:tRNA1(Val) A37 N6-methylase TrmN6
MKSKPERSYVMYSTKEAERTLRPKYMTPYHIQAQWAEFTKLKEAIGEVYRARNRALSIFDIGIGYARIPTLLRTVDTWNKVSRYVGIDISQHCVTQSKRIVTSKKIEDKVEVLKFDAVHLSTKYDESFRQEKYDLVVCTYFTAGDFKPDQIELQTGKDAQIVDYDINLLKPNQNFVAVFKGAFDLLSDGGKIILGSVYRDNELTRTKQERFYTKCEMTVITSERDPFTATKEGFWSERFSEEKIHDYLSWIPSSKIELVPLDDYDFAIMVIITK